MNTTQHSNRNHQAPTYDSPNHWKVINTYTEGYFVHSMNRFDQFAVLENERSENQVNIKTNMPLSRTLFNHPQLSNSSFTFNVKILSNQGHWKFQCFILYEKVPVPSSPVPNFQFPSLIKGP